MLSLAIKKFKLLFTISLFVTVLFLFLPFFDYNNMSAWVTFPSSLVNSLPPFYNSDWPGGYVAITAFIPFFLSYVGSGYNIYVAVVVLKLILLYFTLLTGYVLYSIAKIRGTTKPSYVLIFLLLSPSLIFVNYIMTQLDIIPIFFTILSIYLLRYHYKLRENNIYLIISAISLSLGTFFYFIPILIFPTLLIYTGGARNKIKLFLSTIVILSIFYAIGVLFMQGGNLPTASTLLPSSSTISYYYGLEHYVSLSLPNYLILLGVISCLIPLITKKFGIMEPVAMFIVILLCLYVFVDTVDELLFILPFSILILLESKPERFKFTNLLVLNSYPLVGLFLINFYMGTGYQAGIFYFGYEVFHKNILFIKSIQNYFLWAKIFNISLIISLVLSVFYLLIRFRKTDNSLEGKMNRIIKEKEVHFSFSKANTKWKRIFTILIIVLIVLSSLAFNFIYPSINDNKNVTSFPLYSFGSTPMPIGKETYSVVGNSLLFYPSSPIVDLNRSLNLQSIKTTLIEGVHGNTPTEIPLVHSNLFTINYTSNFALNSISRSCVSPFSTSDVNTTFTKNTPLNSNSTCSSLGLNGSLYYSINDSKWLNNYYYFLFKPIGFSLLQSILLQIHEKNTILEIVLYPGHGVLAKYGSSKTNNSGNYRWQNLAVFPFNKASWNYLILNPVDGSLHINLDNSTYAIKENCSRANITNINIGDNGGGSNYSYRGFVTGLFDSSMAPTIAYSHSIDFVNNYNGSSTFIRSGGNIVRLTVDSSGKNTCVRIQNNSFNVSEKINYIVIGKLIAGPYGLSLEMNSMLISQSGNSGFYLITVFLLLICVFVFPIFSLFLLDTQKNYLLNPHS